MNSLPKTVTRQRRDCDLNPGPSAPESSTLTTRLPSHPLVGTAIVRAFGVQSGARSPPRRSHGPFDPSTTRTSPIRHRRASRRGLAVDPGDRRAARRRRRLSVDRERIVGAPGPPIASQSMPRRRRAGAAMRLTRTDVFSRAVRRRPALSRSPK